MTARDEPGVFWTFVDKGAPDDCWLWLGSRYWDGYGWANRRRAHRVAWELTNGLIPAGLHVLHSCDNPPCCNPAHLSLGTHTANMRDCAAKGRNHMPGGESNGRAKLTEADVRSIRERYDAGGVTQLALGAEFGLAQSTISTILARRLWKHVPNGER